MADLEEEVRQRMLDQLVDGPDDALKLWELFPVGAQPRPIVFMVTPFDFRRYFSDLQTQAYLHGAIVFDVDVPALLRHGLCRRPRPYQGRPLTVTAFGVGTEDFYTDRGRYQLRVWTVQIEGVLGTIPVPDPHAGHWWPPRWSNRFRLFEPRRSAHLGPDNRTITYPFATAPPRFVSFPTTIVRETATTVLIQPEPVWTGLSNYQLTLTHQQVTVVLERPLGNRVLIQHGGYPIAVTGTLPREAAKE